MTAWGGLGRFIVDGFGQQDNAQIVAGALLVGLMALVTELALARVQRSVVSQGLRAERVGVNEALAAPVTGPGGRSDKHSLEHAPEGSVLQ